MPLFLYYIYHCKMKLRDAILKEHSKAQKDKIVAWVGNSQTRFDELIKLMLTDKDEKVTQRAAYPMSYCVEAHPSLVTKHLGKLIKNISNKEQHNAILRNTFRALDLIAIPEKFHGVVMNICFDSIQSPEEHIAVKSYALSILDKLSRIYPDISPELKLIIQERWNYETAAFHSRGRKILKRLK